MQNGRTNIWVYTGVLAYLKILADALHFNQIIQLLVNKIEDEPLYQLRHNHCPTDQKYFNMPIYLGRKPTVTFSSVIFRVWESF